MGALFGPYCAFCAPLSELPRRSIIFLINALDDLRHNLAKVEVASSSLVSRSKTSLVVNDLGSFGGHEFGDSARLEKTDCEPRSGSKNYRYDFPRFFSTAYSTSSSRIALRIA
jgi:hypothetical protein